MKEEYKGEQVPVIVYVPANTVKLKIEATLMDEDDSLYSAINVLHIQDIMDARIDGEEWERENVTWQLTDKAKKELGIE